MITQSFYTKTFYSLLIFYFSVHDVIPYKYLFLLLCDNIIHFSATYLVDPVIFNFSGFAPVRVLFLDTSLRCF